MSPSFESAGLTVLQLQVLSLSALVVALVAIISSWRGRRAMVRRVASVISRLETVGTVDVVGKGGLEASLAALERAAGSAALKVGDAEVSIDRLGEALRLVPHGVVVSDDNGDVVYRNERAEELVAEGFGDPLAAEVVDRLLAAAPEEGTVTETVELFGPPHRTLQIHASPIANHSKLIGAASVIEDISDQRRLEAVRRDFVANISHELKTPVGALGLLAETLDGEEDTAVVSRLAHRMRVEALRVGRIIDDLLDLSRIESEEAPRRQPVPVHLVLAEAAERVRSVAAHAGVVLDIEDAPQRLTVRGDRRQLVSAVHSLLENGVSYSNEGAEVTVRVRTNGTSVEITVVDRGIGIPERDLDRIFERFYRVDHARTRRTGGTGLGLSIVRHVASNHGGDVRVQSQEGKGSTFTLRLPAGPGPVAVSAEAG